MTTKLALTQSSVALARDKWIKSKKGEACLNVQILRSPEDRKYLESRLGIAFEAGAYWYEQIEE